MDGLIPHPFGMWDTHGGKFATSTPSKIPGVGNRTTTIKTMIL
jgi:hypothetical protein